MEKTICYNCRLVAKYLDSNKLDFGFASQYWCGNCKIDFANISKIEIANIANQIQTKVEIFD